MIRLSSLHSHSGASSKEGDREARRGWREERAEAAARKNDAAAVLGACRQTEREREREGKGSGGGGRLAQSAVSDVGFTVSNPSGDLLRFSSVLNTLE